MAPKTTNLMIDLNINAAKFDPAATTEETVKAKASLANAYTTGPKWYEVGAAEYRKMREQGQTTMRAAAQVATARDITIPSRGRGGERDIPVRICTPSNGRLARGILLHIHGGGFVLNNHRQYDSVLAKYADGCQLMALSVGYRLAPEHPYPAATEDCIAVAEYLVEHGEERFGSKLRFIVGNSVGGCLGAVTVFSLTRSHPSHKLAGVIFLSGQFDVTLGLPLPSTYDKPLLLNTTELQHFANAYTPGLMPKDRKRPDISPLYEDVTTMAAAAPAHALPPALFHIGMDDPFLDENILMTAKWQISGSEAVLRLYAGYPHGFDVLGGQPAAECDATNTQFLNENWKRMDDATKISGTDKSL
ncbi:Alpha/Beta hydrolase protein [Xylariaceae sp. FL0255]|nr:Alpha/Beta hydrolase protein [Xylariaceae sp. FL0255]